ncbi:hypothetical protein OMK64_13070 [Cellulomonas fimi]|uniref:F390 synthetase-related protein n=1 Tax=Cellulomonas fimi TaxID=1708 RepID=UPI00234C4D37|nr:F390 synthetase-related protein [Cellulomonas fimi]MDC7122465.1 hypothetical protein [Cellulomonas fimi]
MSRARVVWHYARARRRTFAHRAALEAWQDRHLRRVLRLAPRRYAFYAGTTPRTLTDLPVVDKADVLARFADLNVRGVGLDECLAAARSAERGRDFGTTLRGLSVGLSSGTTGRQTAFLTSAAERDRWAGEVLARTLPEGLLAGARVTLVLRAGGPLYESVDGGRVSFRFVDLALDEGRLLDEIRAADPTVLVAPPSVLVAVARADLGLRPQRVLSVAEVLDPHDAAVVEDGLGVRVDQVYQAAEGFLGASCRHGRLHLAEDLVVVEREDVGGGRFVPVVTDLFRSSQAVLRRRVGDVLVPDEDPCPCGSPMLAVREIVGRSDDVLWLARAGAAGAVPGSFHPDFVRAAVLAVPEVDDFRVDQTATDVLRLAVEPATAFDAARRSLERALADSGLTVPSIVPGVVEPRDPLVKRRRVRRDPAVPAGTR